MSGEIGERPELNGIVEGTEGDDRIDLAYTGDPEGDRIDAGDAILPGAGPDDDLVLAFGGNDTVEAARGNDEVFGGDGDDHLMGGPGNDTLHGEGGDDILDGDGGAGTQPSVTVTFVNETAGYLNTVGIYEIDPVTGAISNVRIGFENASLPGDGGNLPPGSTFSFPVTPGAQVGLFIVANGAALNDYAGLGEGELRFVDENGNPATIATTNPSLVHVGTDGTVTPINGLTYHSAGHGANAGLNPDGQLHTALYDAGADSIEIGFEDLFWLGDADFDDPVLRVTLSGNTSLNNAHVPVVGNEDGDAPGNDLLYGGDGNDTAFGGAGDDTIFGGAGDDELSGGDDNDEIHGGDGDDTIDGGDGADTLYGGDGQDTFRNPTSGDRIFGGDGGIDFDTLDLRGIGRYRIEDRVPDSDGNGFDGRVVMLDGDGNPVGEFTFENIENIIPCFTPGTLIVTPRGQKPVEELRPGDRVITRDNGIREIAWTGSRTLTAAELARAPHLRPVLIRAGALGQDLPERDLLVSPNHRMLVANERTSLWFDEHEVLVAAKHLVGGQGVARLEVPEVTYIHFLFETHEIVLANGAWTESFQPGHQTLDGMGAESRDEILALFPELNAPEGLELFAAARKTLKRHEALLLTR